MSLLAVAALLLALGLLCSALFSGAETGAHTFNRTRHRLRVAERGRRALLVERLTHDLTGFLVICLIGTHLANTLVSYASTMALEQLGVGAAELAATIAVGPLLFIVGELAPKELFRRHPDRLLYATAPVVAGARLVLWPAVAALGLLTRALRRGHPSDRRADGAAEERLRQLIIAGGADGTVTDYQATLAQNIFSLRARRVRHVMMPLAKVRMFEAAQGLEEARAEARQHGHGRYPVYRHRPEQVVGVVDAYELEFEERPGVTIRNYVGPVLTIDPEERVAEALVRLRRARARLAVVTRGERALGIVTAKDLVEEITGELRDL